jgi:predicted ABC-class ATPase
VLSVVFKGGSLAYQPNTEQLLLMQEMQRGDVKYAAQQLGKEYIELATDLPSFPVRGLVYDNEMGRRVVCLTFKEHTRECGFRL